MKKSTGGALAGVSGIAGLTLMAALAEADSMRYTDLELLNTGLDDAATVALANVAGDIIEAELETDSARSIWEIEIVSGSNQVTRVEVDGLSGEILNTRVESEDVLDPSEVVSLDEAIEIVKAVENGALIEAELEADGQDLFWEIEALGPDNKEFEYRINATTGEII